MKKLIYNMFVGASVIFMTSCMGIDNFDEPDCHFTGRIIDSTTGKNILTSQGESRVRIWEKSFSTNPADQNIPIKQDGEYNNTKLFAGTYDVVPQGAFWPQDTVRIGLGSKKTVRDFEVTPYLKLVDFKYELFSDNDSLRMSCRLDTPPIIEGLPTIMEVRPFLSMNQFCGSNNRIDYYHTNANRKNLMMTWDKVKKDENDSSRSEAYEFRLMVKRGYTYFIRMGAKVRDDFENYNYTEIVKIEIPQ